MDTVYMLSEMPEERVRVKQTSYSDYLIAFCICLVFCVFFLLTTPGLFHWFLLPVFLCGVIIGADGVVWFRRKCDPFDLKGIIGCFGFHFFFIAPLIYLYLGIEMAYVDHPNDWRVWFGYMAFVNLAGILTYKLFQRIGYSGDPKPRKRWYINPDRTWFVLNSGIVIGIFGQIFIFIKSGGIAGIMHARHDPSAGFGMGIPRIFGAALPILCFIAFTIYICSNRMQIRRVTTILISLFLLFVLQLIVTGVYSSRGIILTPIFWGLGIIHYFWRPLSHKFIILLLIPGILFLWFYSFYKALGSELFEQIESGTSVSDLSQQTGRTFGGMLIGDLSRADVQAYILYAQQERSMDYDLRYGKIYLEDISPVIPYWIWRSKPADAGKVRAGTELFYGKGYYDRQRSAGLRSTRAYGLAGEAMLNFGFLGVPFVFAFWGFLVGRCRRYINSLQAGDLRFLFVPYVLWFLPGMLVWDMDNYIAHTLMRAIFPIIIIYFMSEKSWMSYSSD